MNIFKNKFFLLGNLAFLLLVIPVALFFIKNQTSTRGSAAPSTTLTFSKPNLPVNQCDNTQTTVLRVNPGQNVISTIQLALKWDKTKFGVEFAPNQAAFPQTLKGPTDTSDGMTITLNIGGDVTKAITKTTDVGTFTIKPLAPTNGTLINMTIDPAGTKVYSLSQQDGATENVFSSADPLSISIIAQDCTSVSPSPSGTTDLSPSPTTTISPTVAVTATPAVNNQSPVCLNLTTSTSSGSAPLSVTLTAGGKDNDGTIAKATFNFGDGTQQDVTTGLGTASVSAQLAHTYNSGGNFNATTVFTDNGGAVSATCSQPIAVAGAIATIAPINTPTPTMGSIAATEIPTATPTINSPGGIGATIGLIGGIVLTIAAGIFLLAL